MHQVETRGTRHVRRKLIEPPGIEPGEMLRQVGLMGLLAAVQQIGHQGDSDRRPGISHHVVETRRVAHTFFFDAR